MTTRAALWMVLAIGCAGERPPPPAADAAARFPALAGAWSGGAESTPYGPARATLFVGPDGWGSVTVMAMGKVVSRRFRIVAWDGRTARLDSDGTWEVPVTVEGSELSIEVPGVGVVRLRR